MWPTARSGADGTLVWRALITTLENLERGSKAPERHISQSTPNPEGKMVATTPIKMYSMAGHSPAQLAYIAGLSLFNIEHHPAPEAAKLIWRMERGIPTGGRAGWQARRARSEAAAWTAHRFAHVGARAHALRRGRHASHGASRLPKSRPRGDGRLTGPGVWWFRTS